MKNSNPRFISLLSDIHYSIGRINQCVEGITLEDLLGPDLERERECILWNFTVIGEASAALVKRFPGSFDKDMLVTLIEARGFRNRIVHNYSMIDWSLVWPIIHKDLPPLLCSIESFLPSDSRSEDPLR